MRIKIKKANCDKIICDEVKEAREWFKKAEKDLDDAEFNLKGDRLEVSAFLAHQAAEKALKALYILKFKRLWRIHDLVRLGVKVNAPDSILKLCDRLNPHYIETRYPVETEYTKGRCEEAIELAKGVIEWARGRARK